MERVAVELLNFQDRVIIEGLVVALMAAKTEAMQENPTQDYAARTFTTIEDAFIDTVSDIAEREGWRLARSRFRRGFYAVWVKAEGEQKAATLVEDLLTGRVDYLLPKF